MTHLQNALLGIAGYTVFKSVTALVQQHLERKNAQMHPGHHDCIADGHTVNFLREFMEIWENEYNPSEEAQIELRVYGPYGLN